MLGEGQLASHIWLSLLCIILSTATFSFLKSLWVKDEESPAQLSLPVARLVGQWKGYEEGTSDDTRATEALRKCYQAGERMHTGVGRTELSKASWKELLESWQLSLCPSLASRLKWKRITSKEKWRREAARGSPASTLMPTSGNASRQFWKRSKWGVWPNFLSCTVVKTHAARPHGSLVGMRVHLPYFHDWSTEWHICSLGAEYRLWGQKPHIQFLVASQVDQGKILLTIIDKIELDGPGVSSGYSPALCFLSILGGRKEYKLQETGARERSRLMVSRTLLPVLNSKEDFCQMWYYPALF